MEDGKRKQLIEIQIYLGVTEYTCRHCGGVNSWESTNIVPVQFKNSKKSNYKPMCADCNCSGAWLLQSKTERIYWKGSMSEVGKFDSKLLGWMIEKNYFGIKAPRVKAAVVSVLENRLFKPEEIQDIIMNAEEVRNLDRIKEVNDDIRDHEKVVSDSRHVLTEESQTLDYHEVKKFTKIIETRNRRIATARKILAELLNIEDDEKKEQV